MAEEQVTQEDYLRLREQARAGRGLWIGIDYVKQGVGTAHPVEQFLPPTAHITLLHLGKRCDDDLVHVAMLAAHDAVHTSMPWWPMPLEVTGVGRFWRKGEPTPIALINSGALCEVRQAILHGVVARRKDYFAQDRYGFVPHITLDHRANSAMETKLTFGVAPLRWMATGVQVHCGEVSVHVEHKAPW